MIYDCFTFFNELDILEARLHEMSPVVDRFVLVEAKQTFTGKPKPLYFHKNKARFASFANQIEHVIVDFPSDLSHMHGKKCTNDAWAREHYQRQQIGRGLRMADPDDLVIVSDVDEILSARVLKRVVAQRRRGDLTVFTMPIYAYFANRRAHGPEWTLGPRMVESRHFKDGQRLRMTKLYASRALARTTLGRVHTRLWNWVNCGVAGRVVEVNGAGWHLSSIGSWQSFRQKIEAYSHFERMESGMYRSEAEFRAEVGSLTYEVDGSELPEFVNANPAMFARMSDEAVAA